MEVMRKLFFSRFSPEEFKQFKEIYQEETKNLRRRPQFIVGVVLMGALMFYFLFKAFGTKTLHWPSTVDIVGAVGGTFAGLFTAWLLIRWLKLSKLFKTSFLLFFGVFFLFFLFLAQVRNSSPMQWQWEYLIYVLIVLAGFCCVNDSVREYFCEKLLRLQQKHQGQHKVEDD